jgi:flavorubredoxin
MRTFIDHLTERSYQNRTVAFMENGSWAPVAAKTMAKMLEGSKNITFAQNTVTVASALSEKSIAQIEALAQELAE